MGKVKDIYIKIIWGNFLSASLLTRNYKKKFKLIVWWDRQNLLKN